METKTYASTSDFQVLYADVKNLARHLRECGVASDDIRIALQKYWGEYKALAIYLTALKFA